MNIPIVSTKLYIPAPRSNIVDRQRLIERLNEGLLRKLTVISASAGYGKTTLVSEWLAGCGLRTAWLSLDEGDNEPARFLIYLVAAFQSIGANIGEGNLPLLQSLQPPPIESIVTSLLNEIASIPDHFVLVLDDYHVIHAETANKAIEFLLERMPPQMHLVIITREDPRLPIPRLRVRNQLVELRATDLRFTSYEAAEFLEQVMKLNLSRQQVAHLETRTEGWIAGLQLAALSLQGHNDADGFIHSFNGSHHHVLDYLVEEVLQQQSAAIQAFLLRTSILDRMCGSLCDAVARSGDGSASGQQTLEYLEHANLFLVPLDDERRWYRYHHLFAQLLRERLLQSTTIREKDIAALHLNASDWFENNGFEIEAFQHAVAAGDMERAVRLVEGRGMPLLFRGAVNLVRNWLGSLPDGVLDANPSLWVMYASALLMTGEVTGVEQKLHAAERALEQVEQDDKIRDVIGHMASIRATLAVSKHQAETILAESRRALDNLHPHNLPVRTATTWALGYAYELLGDRAAAREAYDEALSISRRIGHFMMTMMASIGVGHIQEAENQLVAAAKTYRSVLTTAGDPPLPAACEAHLGLARIYYEWNDLEAAEQHGQKAVHLARQLEQTDRAVAGEVFLAKLQLARGEAGRAAAILAKAEDAARRRNFTNQISHIGAAQALASLREGNLTAAAHLAQKHELPISQARVHLAQGDAHAALTVLEPLRRHADEKGWVDQKLKLIVLQAVAWHVQGEMIKAWQWLADALTMAAPDGFIRTFIDEGMPMYTLLCDAAAHGLLPEYVGKLLAEFEAVGLTGEIISERQSAPPAQPLVEPLSERELEVLHLIAQGLSNREISDRLYLALSTVKGHNRIIFDKLQASRRTEAVARARELGLL